ncbi:MAG: marine proteobacterial sortase target protein, partial [Gammaproteobacteria bacterium]
RRDGESAYQALPTVDTRVGMDITALTARVRVAQRFTNPGEDWINAVYVFPLPDTAAVDRLKLSIGDRIVEGEIQGRQQARKTYQAAKAVGRKAGLVEQQRPNLFTTRVANIGPGETVTVDIEYQQKVTYERGRFSLRFPLTVGIRYIPGQTVVEGFDAGGWSYNTDQVSDASAITPPVVEPGRGIDNPVQMDIRLRAGMPLTEVSSAYHPISTRQSPDGDYRLSLAEGSVPADRDFELAWVPERAREPRAALFTQGAEDDAELYSLLMLMPPEVDAAKRNVPPRDMVFVIDTSGSMSGTSMEQAKAALLMGLGRLKAQDRFQLIEFNTVTRAMSDVLIPPSARNLAWARRWVERLRADGGTEIGRALEKALDSDPSEVEAGRMRQVIFLTDGSVGNELALFRIIADRLGRQRLYTVGIGSAPNSHFMREAAATGRGTFTHIGDVGEVAKRMDELFGKLEYPVLSDIQLSWLDGSGEGLPTGGVRDLYLHEPLMVTLKHGGGRGQIQVSGRFAGQPWSTRLPVRGGAMGRGLDV